MSRLTPEMRQLQLQRRRHSQRVRRQEQSAEERRSRQEQDRLHRRQSRARQQGEQRDAMLERDRLSRRESRARQQGEQRDAMLERDRLSRRESRARQQHEDRNAMLDRERLRLREWRATQQAEVSDARVLFQQQWVKSKMAAFHSKMAEYQFNECTTCCESFPGLRLHSTSTECIRCSRDSRQPKLYSCDNNMDPGPVPPPLQGLTQVEEMLISAVMPMMSLYRLPHGQIGYSGHVINLPQDVSTFVSSLPRLPTEIDIIVVRREGVNGSHKDFRVRRSKVLDSLRWLQVNNIYYRDVTLNHVALAQLPEDGDLPGLPAVTVDPPCTDESDMHPDSQPEDPYNAYLSGTFVPMNHRMATEQETVRQCSRQTPTSSH